MDALAGFGDYVLHEAIIDIIAKLYYPSHAQDMEFVLENINEISEAVAAMIVHSETRIS